MEITKDPRKKTYSWPTRVFLCILGVSHGDTDAVHGADAWPPHSHAEGFPSPQLREGSVGAKCGKHPHGKTQSSIQTLKKQSPVGFPYFSLPFWGFSRLKTTSILKSGWWLNNPSEKYAPQTGSSWQVGVKIQRIFETTT